MTDRDDGGRVSVVRRVSNKRIKGGFVIPSAAFAVPQSQIVRRGVVDKPPQVGDLVYGKVVHLGHHTSLENVHGRIHTINNGSKAVFVLGNRYAPDHYEGVVPNADGLPSELDMLARSGLVGSMRYKRSNLPDPTKVKIYGYVVGAAGVLNTRQFFRAPGTKRKSKVKMILCVGTSMNSGKSRTAAACCWALANMGHCVRAAKITGTASLKDILLMEDCGAEKVYDFTYFGHPSTYLLSEEELNDLYEQMRFYAGRGYWVVEIADGILQREAAMLLRNKSVRSAIHKLIFCSHDAMGAIGGVRILKDELELEPDAVSGVCSSSPLSVKEMSTHVPHPTFDNMRPDLNVLSNILL